MKTLHNVGAIVALLFSGAGLLEWWLQMSKDNQYVLYILVGVSLSLTVNIFHLYGRIAELEKRSELHSPPCSSKSINN